MIKRKQPEEEKVEAKKAEPVMPPVKETPEPKPLYVHAMWKGALQVYRCTKCGVCMNDEDDMKLHVLNHYPAREQNSILEGLVSNEVKK